MSDMPSNAAAQSDALPMQGKVMNIERGIDGKVNYKFEKVNIDDLNPTHYINKSKAQMQSLVDDIRLNGINEPVNYVDFNGQKYIVNGNHRYFAAQKLGIQSIPANQVSLPHGGYSNTFDLFIEGKMPSFWYYLK